MGAWQASAGMARSNSAALMGSLSSMCVGEVLNYLLHSLRLTREQCQVHGGVEAGDLKVKNWSRVRPRGSLSQVSRLRWSMDDRCSYAGTAAHVSTPNKRPVFLVIGRGSCGYSMSGCVKGHRICHVYGLWYTAPQRRTEGDQPRFPALPAAVAARLASPTWSVAIRMQTTC